MQHICITEISGQQYIELITTTENNQIAHILSMYINSVANIQCFICIYIPIIYMALILNREEFGSDLQSIPHTTINKLYTRK